MPVPTSVAPLGLGLVGLVPGRLRKAWPILFNDLPIGNGDGSSIYLLQKVNI